MNSWLKDEKLFLRSPEPEDLELLFEMENDTDMWEVGSTLLPYSRYTLREYLQNSRQDLFAERQARFVIELNSGEKTGFIDLVEYDPINSRAEVCIGLLGKWRNKGIATKALALVCNYAMNKLQIHQLYSYIPEKNEASYRLFEKAGFAESAVLKQWLRKGDEYTNVYLMQKIGVKE